LKKDEFFHPRDIHTLEQELLENKFIRRGKPKKKQNAQNKSIINYSVDLGMLVTSIIILTTGIIKFLNIWANLKGLSSIAAFLTELHDWSGIILGVFVFTHFALHWKWMIATTKKILKPSKVKRKKLNYFIELGMLISFLIIFITGILKWPTLLLIVGYFYTVSEAIFILHDWLGIVLTSLVIIHLILHRKWFVRMTRKLLHYDRFKIIIEVGGIITLLLMIILPSQLSSISQDLPGDEVNIQGFGTLNFNPGEIETIRPDLFKDGHYSIFDILVDLDNRNLMNMDYAYNTDMDTYVINSINGEINWWYTAYYDGGWEELNVFRMDRYPYKPKMYIRLFRTTDIKLQKIYTAFLDEMERLNENNGTVIIPNVIIRSPRGNLNFKNIVVSSHNLRNDFFLDGVITAIDVIMSLGDQGMITYKLNWYDEIGNAEVKNYYVDGINGQNAYGKCGFVYEAGDLNFKLFGGNHIHIPSDIRIISSPEYEEWFWICL
jgi:hypothetical protein